MRRHAGRYRLPDDLRGKTVIDVGVAGGFFSIEAEKRGADVLACDLTPWQDHGVPTRWFARKHAVQTPEEQDHDDRHMLHAAFVRNHEAVSFGFPSQKGLLHMCAMMGFEDLELVGSYELVKQVGPITRAEIVVVHATRHD